MRYSFDNEGIFVDDEGVFNPSTEWETISGDVEVIWFPPYAHDAGSCPECGRTGEIFNDAWNFCERHEVRWDPREHRFSGSTGESLETWLPDFRKPLSYRDIGRGAVHWRVESGIGKNKWHMKALTSWLRELPLPPVVNGGDFTEAQQSDLNSLAERLRVRNDGHTDYYVVRDSEYLAWCASASDAELDDALSTSAWLLLDASRVVIVKQVKDELGDGCGPGCYLCCQSMYCYRAEFGDEAYLRAWAATLAKWEQRRSQSAG